MVVGYFMGVNNAQSGFELIAGKYRGIKPPSASNSVLYGISASGQIVGQVVSINQTTDNFLFRHGAFSSISIPSASNALVVGINPAGTALVGHYQPSSFGSSYGFVYAAKVTHTLAFPSAADTGAFAINALGEVVGVFYDVNFQPHGFTWTPSSDAPKP
jgi:probable HAF family extracellular repeat protein